MSLYQSIKKQIFVQRGAYFKPMYYANGKPIFEEKDRDRVDGEPRSKSELEQKKSQIQHLSKDKDAQKGLLGIACILITALSFFISIKVGVVVMLIILALLSLPLAIFVGVVALIVSVL